MIRRNFLDLSTAERETFAAAFNHVNSTGLIDTHAVTHENYFYSGIHWRSQFLPWHRYFLRKLELALQEFDGSVMLPYWNWTRSDSDDIDVNAWESIFGGRDNIGGKFDSGWSYLRNGDGDGWNLPSLSHVVAELSAATFAEYRKVEGANGSRMGSHVHAHVWVGGTMSVGDSPRDPLFYLHHCNIDRLWAIWQINNAGKSQYDDTTVIESDARAPLAPYVGADEEMPEVTTPWQNQPGFSGATPNQMLNHRELGFFEPVGGYGYGRDSALEVEWEQAHGNTLITDIPPTLVIAGL
uniref:tyrosinase family protein n=1 Tax=Pararhizobium sp. IMCC3301 TaxID=3067904 RepID=UPI0027410709|nr:tyrosinase family protein [Pararhizobium sp. IMCC3301]